MLHFWPQSLGSCPVTYSYVNVSVQHDRSLVNCPKLLSQKKTSSKFLRQAIFKVFWSTMEKHVSGSSQSFIQAITRSSTKYKFEKYNFKKHKFRKSIVFEIVTSICCKYLAYKYIPGCHWNCVRQCLTKRRSRYYFWTFDTIWAINFQLSISLPKSRFIGKLILDF